MEQSKTPLTAEEIADKYLTPLGGSKLHRPYYIMAINEALEAERLKNKSLEIEGEEIELIKTIFDTWIYGSNSDKLVGMNQIIAVMQSTLSELARLRQENEKLVHNMKLITEIISTERHQNNLNNPDARFPE